MCYIFILVLTLLQWADVMSNERCYHVLKVTQCTYAYTVYIAASRVKNALNILHTTYTSFAQHPKRQLCIVFTLDTTS